MRALRRLPGAPAAVALLMLVVSGCSGIGAVVDQTILPATESPGERWHMALKMLGSGEERQAEELFEDLRDTPGYAERSKHMLEQIRRPIHRYFPDDHFNVRLRAGQTLSALSRHYLDDPLKFFALARYNGIAAPNRVAAGQLIRIPLTEHASGVRIAEMGSPDADDPIDDSSGIDEPSGIDDSAGTVDTRTPVSRTAEGDGDSDDDGSTADEQTDTGAPLSDSDRALIRRYYRKATIAFQQQDLDRTLWYCGRVLEMDTDHQHCLSYRDRAEALQQQLDRIQREEKTATGE
ncbi:hypothetical protein [Halofilum ochraceum]|uniref:hypothetical protein n=1 Tax=Halofilum ochraceum TaxID=1611323 RepID=UPI0008DA8965|nr:hypothetical protein [Halofilum ochraceum]